MPSRRFLRSLCFALYFAAAGLPGAALAQASPPTTATAPTIRDDVRKLHNDALLALKRNQVEAAYKGFLEAWTLQKIPRIAGNLGRAELKLGKHRDAAEHLALFLRESRDLGDEERKELEAQLAEAKAHVGVVRVAVAQDGAEVWVDGTAAGTAPLVHEIYLAPGRHTVEARHAGTLVKKDFDAQPGAVLTVRLDAAPPPPASSPVPSAASSAGIAESRSMVPVFVLGGVGAAGIIAGATSLGLYSARRDEALALRDAIQSGGGRCNERGTEHPDCDSLRAIASEGDVFRVAGPIFLGSGLALAAAAGAYLLWWPASSSLKDDKGGAAGLRVNVAASPERGAVSISGSF